MRTAFIDALCKAANEDPKIFLLCGDLGYSVLERFSDRYPERFLNCGVAEQNMIGVAVGLAREGWNVFVYSIGNFPTLRCMEQIRYDVCYHEANVKIVAVGAGYAYGQLGASHHATEDISMLRVLPNMAIAAPADPVETRAVLNWMVKHKGPGYIRLNKSGEKSVHAAELKQSPQRGIDICSGDSVVVLSTGAILEGALQHEKVRSGSYGLVSMPIIKPMDKKKILDIALRYKKIITVEEHQLAGGFGSAVLEVLNDYFSEGRLSKMPIVKRIGINDFFVGEAGTQRYLRERAGLLSF